MKQIKVRKSRADKRGGSNMMPKDVNKVAGESMKSMTYKTTPDGRPMMVKQD